MCLGLLTLAVITSAIALAEDQGPAVAIKYIEKADHELSAENIDKAISLYRKAAQAAPLNASAHQRLANALSIDGQLGEAEQENKRALELDPHNALAHANLGWIYGRQGKFKAAIAEEKLALEVEPSMALAHQTLGLALTSLGDYPEAIKSFERAIVLDPEDMRSYLNLAAAMGRKGDYAGSISVYRKAISLNRRSVLAHIGLAAALGKVGDLKGQINELEQAVAIDPRSSVAHGRLGMALSQAKNWRAALREGIISNILRLENSWTSFMPVLITAWAAVFLAFGALFAFIFFGSRFKPQPGEEVLSSYFLVFYKERPGRFVITTRRLVYVPEAVSQWFGATRVSMERDQVEKIEAHDTISGGVLSVYTKDESVHKFAMPNLVLEPLYTKLRSLPPGDANISEAEASEAFAG